MPLNQLPSSPEQQQAPLAPAPSAATQQKFLESYASHPLAPNAMLNLANSQIQLGQIPAAKKTLKELIAAYPSAEVTPSAQKRLKVLESIK